jgi:hypothetical protein
MDHPMASLDMTGHRIRFGYVETAMNLGPHGGHLGIGSGREPGEVRQITAVLGTGPEHDDHKKEHLKELNSDF